MLVNTTFHRAVGTAALEDPDISPLGRARSLRAEVALPSGRGRADFLVGTAGGDVWVETKGCTLAEGEVGLFPDAPTSRGRRHMEELTEIARSGGDAAVLFLVMVHGVAELRANWATDPGFATAMEAAAASGVRFHALALALESGAGCRELRFRAAVPVLT